VEVNGGSVPPLPAPDQLIAQVIVALTGKDSSGRPAEDRT
jgi:hypothetical protein